MAKKNNPPVDDPVILPDEPVFMLLGRDPQAANLVRLWAEGRDFLQGAGDPQVAVARKRADEMERWCTKHNLKPVDALSLLPFELLATELRRRGAAVTPCTFEDDVGDGNGLNS